MELCAVVITDAYRREVLVHIMPHSVVWCFAAICLWESYLSVCWQLTRKRWGLSSSKWRRLGQDNVKLVDRGFSTFTVLQTEEDTEPVG